MRTNLMVDLMLDLDFKHCFAKARSLGDIYFNCFDEIGWAPFVCELIPCKLYQHILIILPPSNVA